MALPGRAYLFTLPFFFFCEALSNGAAPAIGDRPQNQVIKSPAQLPTNAPSQTPADRDANLEKTPQKADALIDDEALQLVQRFVDVNDTKLSWQEFAQDMARIFQKDQKYKPLAETFRDITNSTFTSWIGFKLSWHESIFPPKTATFIKKYTGSEFANIAARRIKLNKKK